MAAFGKSRSARVGLACLPILLAWTWPAYGVIVAGSDGTQNTSAPADDPGWGNVGILNGDTGVYLMHDWVLTANHVGPGTIRLGGVDYSAVPGSWHQFHDPNNSSVLADLGVFQLSRTPTGVRNLSIASSTPASNASVLAIGNGMNRQPNLVHWNSSTNPWTVVSSGGDMAGYDYGSGTTMRWGTNQVTASGLSIDYKGMTTVVLQMDFDSPGTSSEMIYAPGDSGGPLFQENGANWDLVGTAAYLGTFDTQPSNTAVFGDASYAVDLSQYRNQILSIVPEPSAWAMMSGLGVVGSGVGAWRWSRRRRRRRLDHFASACQTKSAMISRMPFSSVPKRLTSSRRISSTSSDGA